MAEMKFGVAGHPIKVWHEIYAAHLANEESTLAELKRNGLDDLISRYRLAREPEELSKDPVEVIVRIKLQYDWVVKSFDGGAARKLSDDIINRLIQIRELCEKLSEITENHEYFYLSGDRFLNTDRLQKYKGSDGEYHDSVNSFFGTLMTRLCIDATNVYEGLIGIEGKLDQKDGRPPKVSKNWLILSAADFYEDDEIIGRKAGITKRTISSRSDPYSSDFYEFVTSFAAVIDAKNYSRLPENQGFGSQIQKVLTARKNNPAISNGLNPYQDPETLILFTNMVAKL